MAPALARGEVPGTIYGMSPKGWMDQDLFDLWFTHHFLRYDSGETASANIRWPLLSLLPRYHIKRAFEEDVIVFTLPTQPISRSLWI